MKKVINILIVEDDDNIARYIKAVIEMGGYKGEICNDGEEAIKKVYESKYDLILLDVMLPKFDGFEIMEEIAHLGIAVIFLTAVQEVTEKVRGLKLGAQDYIVKPFEAIELLARIEVILKRYKKYNNCLTYRNISIDLERHLVINKNEEIALTPKEFEVLVFFIQHKDIIVSRERLLSAIWGCDFMGESRTIDTHVQQVRKKVKLQDNLITVPKYGYKLIKEN